MCYLIQIMKTFMRRLIFFFIAILFVGLAKAQVAINTDGSAANSSAMLDVVSSNKGVLIPRVLDTTSVASPAIGLLIYRTTIPQGFFYYNGLKWERLSSLTLPLSIANGGTGSITQNFVDLTTTQTVGGLKTWSNLGVFNAGIASTGAIINLNASSNFATNINTGTSNGAVNIANGTTGGNTITIGNIVGSTGVVQRVGTGNYSLDGVAGSTYTFGASTITGTITIGGTAQTGAIGIGTGTGAQTLNFGTGGTGIKNINIGTGAVANTILIGNTTAGTRTALNVVSPTAQLHLGAGRNTANQGAPLKFTSGTNLTTPENGAVEFDGTNYYVTSNTTRYTLAKTLTATASLNFGNTPTNTSRDLTIAVNGAALSDVVVLGIPNSAVNNNTSFSAWVSSANTVSVRFNNYSSGNVNPGAGTFRVSVLKY